MIDRLFIDSAPEWINLQYETLMKEVKVKLENESETYRSFIEKEEELYKRYPKIELLMENAEELLNVTFTKEEVRGLDELVQVKNELNEMYQRMMYIKGIKDGILLSMYSDITKE